MCQRRLEELFDVNASSESMNVNVNLNNEYVWYIDILNNKTYYCYVF